MTNMKTYRKLAITLSLGLSLLGCGGVGSDATATKDLPVAVDDTASVSATQKKLTVIPVLDNDSPKGALDNGSVEVITPPQYGTVNIRSTGEVEYNPTSSPLKADSFVYTVKDNEGNFSNPATVTITVTQLPFKITVKTDNAGVSNDNEFTIPIVGGSYDIDCGDAGAINGVAISGNYTCTYPSNGTYTIGITGDIPQVSFFTDGTDVKDNLKLLSVDQWGSGQWSSMYFAFFSCSNMTLVAVDTPNLSAVKDLRGMFYSASSFNGNIGKWDVSTITNMQLMFRNATSFEGIELGLWGNSVKNVENMNSMFAGATAFNADIGSWDLNPITKISAMFRGASSYEGLNLALWGDNLKNITSFNSMFNGATNFNGDIGNWDVSSANDMQFMFAETKSFNQDLSNWNVSSVMYMSGMFENASAFDADIGNWNISNVSKMGIMFRGAKLSGSNYDKLLIGWWNIISQGGSLQPNVNFDGGNSSLSSAEAIKPWLQLQNHPIVSPFPNSPSWNITDGGCNINGCP